MSLFNHFFFFFLSILSRQLSLLISLKNYSCLIFVSWSYLYSNILLHRSLIPYHNPSPHPRPQIIFRRIVSIVGTDFISPVSMKLNLERCRSKSKKLVARSSRRSVYRSNRTVSRSLRVVSVSRALWPWPRSVAVVRVSLDDSWP